jgi:hypothetical protein
MAQIICGPGSTKSATVTATVTPAGMSCVGELFLSLDAPGNNKVGGNTDKVLSFSSTGAAQSVGPFVITMPSPTVGTIYYVQVDIFASTYLIVAGTGTDQLVVPAGSIGPISWS